MPLYADLYLDRVDLARYAASETCRICHVDSLDQLVDRLRSGQICPGQCPHWPPERVAAFHYAIHANEHLPTIPSLDVPRPTDAGLFDLNGPTPDSPVLVTGNSRLTHEVLLAVLSTTTAPMWMLSVDTAGHTVDMAMVYKTLSCEAIASALRADDRPADAFTGRIILPGLAAPLAEPLSDLLGRTAKVGPVCAAELPLYFGMTWTR